MKGVLQKASRPKERRRDDLPASLLGDYCECPKAMGSGDFSLHLDVMQEARSFALCDDVHVAEQGLIRSKLYVQHEGQCIGRIDTCKATQRSAYDYCFMRNHYQVRCLEPLTASVVIATVSRASQQRLLTDYLGL